jgi:hypothetical protein
MNNTNKTIVIILRYTKDADGQPLRISLIELAKISGKAHSVIGRTVIWPIHTRTGRAEYIKESNNLAQAWADRANIPITYQHRDL